MSKDKDKKPKGPPVPADLVQIAYSIDYSMQALTKAYPNAEPLLDIIRDSLSVHIRQLPKELEFTPESAEAFYNNRILKKLLATPSVKEFLENTKEEGFTVSEAHKEYFQNNIDKFNEFAFSTIAKKPVSIAPEHETSTKVQVQESAAEGTLMTGSGLLITAFTPLIVFSAFAYMIAAFNFAMDAITNRLTDKKASPDTATYRKRMEGYIETALYQHKPRAFSGATFAENLATERAQQTENTMSKGS
jgi:hypothetical protein